MPGPNPERRSERSRRAILAAAWELCCEKGYAELTIEAIARRAGVGKQTIYRWWPSKASVVLDALDEAIGPAIDFPDTGDVVADLSTQMTGVVKLFTSDDVGPLYRGLIGASAADPDLAAALGTMILNDRVARCKDRLRLAQEAGQLRADADLDSVVELLYSPLYYRLVLHTRPVTPRQVIGILELAFAGLGPDDHHG